jgi:hypothetical protein
MTTARQDLAAHLTATLPAEMKVISALEALTNAKRPVVMVTRSSIEPPPTYQTRDDVLVVWLLSPNLDPVAAEDDLDTNLDVVLAALEATGTGGSQMPALHWTSGQRDVFNGQFHAFRIQVTHRTVTTPEE